MVGLEHFLILSAALFAIGMYGVFVKRNAIAILLCIELMLNAVNIALAGFSRYITPDALTGQIFAIFIMIVAAAEAAIGLAIIIAIFRHRGSIDPEKINLLKW